MKFGKAIQFFGLNLLLAALVLFKGKAGATETHSVRPAIGHFLRLADDDKFPRSRATNPKIQYGKTQ